MGRRVVSRLITGNEERDREKLQILLIKNRTNPTEIGRELGIRSQAVSQVIHRRINSRRVLEYLEHLPVQM